MGGELPQRGRVGDGSKCRGAGIKHVVRETALNVFGIAWVRFARV